MKKRGLPPISVLIFSYCTSLLLKKKGLLCNLNNNIAIHGRPPSLLTLATPLLVAVFNKNLGLNRRVVNTFYENVASCRFLSLLLELFSFFCRFLSLLVVCSYLLQITDQTLLFRRFIRKKREKSRKKGDGCTSSIIQ
jgi:hypothetical protein